MSISVTRKSAFVLVCLCLISRRTFGQCQDKTHYHYTCDQLKRYCQSPQAVAVREKCALTCKLCNRQDHPTEPPLTVVPSETISTSTTVTIENENTATLLLPTPEIFRPATHFLTATVEGILLTTKLQQFGELSTLNATTELTTEALDNERTTNAQLQTVPNLIRPISAADSAKRLLDSVYRPRANQQSTFNKTLLFSNSHEIIRAKDSPLSDDEALNHIQTCCKTAGIRKDCQTLCRYDTTKEEIVAKALSNACNIDDARKWSRCASSTTDNTECCASSNPPVEALCYDLCRGEMPTSFTRILYCINNHLHNILQCHKRNIRR